MNPAPKRLIVVVEGQTESNFVNRVLRSHLLRSGIEATATIVGKAKAADRGRSGPGTRGGTATPIGSATSGTASPATEALTSSSQRSVIFTACPMTFLAGSLSLVIRTPLRDVTDWSRPSKMTSLTGGLLPTSSVMNSRRLCLRHRIALGISLKLLISSLAWSDCGLTLLEWHQRRSTTLQRRHRASGCLEGFLVIANRRMGRMPLSSLVCPA